MHHCFFNYKPIHTNDFILNGTAMPIQRYKKIQINTTKQEQYITILLLNIAYITDYPTNLVSMSIVENKKMHWDNQTKQFTKNKKLFCDIKHYKRHYLLENNTSYYTKQRTTLMLAGFTTKSATTNQ